MSPAHPIPPASCNATRVALDELIGLAALARGARLAQSRRSAAARSGAVRSRWRGRGMDFRESRIYQAGDEIRHMDWRVTARSGKPHTKLFEEEREQALLLVQDFNPSMRFGTRVRFKSVQAARAAALLAWLAATTGDRVGLLGFGGGIGGELRPAGGRPGVLKVLRQLRDWDAAADPSCQQPLAQGLARLHGLLRPGMRVVLLSDGFSADHDGLQRLGEIARHHELAVVRLGDALEREAPPPGRYALHLGPLRGVLDFADRATRTQWAQRFAALRAGLADTCVKHGARLLELDTHADLRTALRPLLARGRAAGVVA
ncbi:DUF58 domain-containing protein [Dokdonella sp.]|uniref:DUF58 domain-containing protein n=1 Tax=Dokdonella sp. TaxID=2291710 RepID=UPI0031BF91FB|nr:DUF58 domain-containing protein [Dokdonella sp.]